MGWNATLIVRHDFLDQIKNDPEFGRKVWQAIIDHNAPPQHRRYHGQAFDVIETHHADTLAVVAVGANTGRVLGHSYWPADDETVAKHVLAQIKRRKKEPDHDR